MGARQTTHATECGHEVHILEGWDTPRFCKECKAKNDAKSHDDPDKSEAQDTFAKQDRSEERAGVVFSHAPAWFAVALALAYATGFLVVSTYLGSFGIPESTSEFLRIKYLQVGLYFLLFFGSMVVFVVLWLRAVGKRKSSPSSSQQPTVPAPETLEPASSETATKKEGAAEDAAKTQRYLIPVWMILVLVVYVTVGFAEPSQTGRQSLPWVGGLIFASFGLAAMVYSLQRRLSKRNPDFHLVAKGVYVGLLAFEIWLGWNVVSPFKEKLGDFLRLQWQMLLILLGFMLVLVFLSYRAVFPRPEFSKEEHLGYMWLRAALVLPIYYLSVLTFAYCIYPFVSESKAGGYFAESGFVKLTIRQPESKQTVVASPQTVKSSSRGKAVMRPIDARPPLDVLPQELMESGLLSSKALVLIEANSTSVFVADPNDPASSLAGGPSGVKCWTDFQCRPKVFEIQISNLARIEHLPVAKRK